MILTTNRQFLKQRTGGLFLSQVFQCCLCHVFDIPATRLLAAPVSILSQVLFAVSHEVPPAGQFLSVGSLSWTGLLRKTTVNMLIQNAQSHCRLTHLLFFSSAILHRATAPMSTAQRWRDEASVWRFVKEKKNLCNWIGIMFIHTKLE